MAISINSQFDGGNIECLSCASADDIHLQIKKDQGGEFFQWFYFRLTGEANAHYTLHIDNAGASSYPKGWHDYRVVASFDRQHWFRCDTQYHNGVLSFAVTAESNCIWFAYFTPYSMQRHDDLIGSLSVCDGVQTEVLGRTVEGRNMDLVVIGNPSASKKIWSIARQHPGETMAQWWMEGFLKKLVDPHDPVSRALLQRCRFYVVPNMNPDGSAHGYLRTNAAGANLNREWSNPSMDTSPEVAVVRARMEQTGVDFCLDVHGDEALPYNFIAGTEGIASWSPQRLELQNRFKDGLSRLNPDFQTVHGYPVAAAGTANYGICSSYIAERFGCPAMTLEMPFKDTVDNPDRQYGWSAQRSIKLGESCLAAIHFIEDSL
jgi:murein tripeptide amidase MpaA